MTDRFEVIRSVAPLFRAASWSSPLETQLVRGEIFLVTNMTKRWAHGQVESPVPGSRWPGYRGYVPRACLMTAGPVPDHIISAMSAPLFSRADIKSPVRDLWPLNARFTGRKDGDFVNTGIGYVHKRHVRPLAGPPVTSDYVAIAEQHMGAPYIWGGVTPAGLDCSGLVQASLRAVGRDAPRDSGDQITMGDEIKPGAPIRRGDLIFWDGHVGIMQDDTRLLHANAYHMSVASEPLSDALDRIGPTTAQRRI